MRTILIDWMVEVHGRFKLLQETLYLTVATMDRFLQVGWRRNFLVIEISMMTLISDWAHYSSTRVATCWTDIHVHCFQIRRDVFSRYSRLRLHVGQSLYEERDFTHGIPNPQGVGLQFRSSSSSSFPTSLYQSCYSQLWLGEYYLFLFFISQIRVKIGFVYLGWCPSSHFVKVFNGIVFARIRLLSLSAVATGCSCIMLVSQVNCFVSFFSDIWHTVLILANLSLQNSRWSWDSNWYFMERHIEILFWIWLWSPGASRGKVLFTAYQVGNKQVSGNFFPF